MVCSRWTRRPITSCWERGVASPPLVRADSADMPACDLEARWACRPLRRSSTSPRRSSTSSTTACGRWCGAWVSAPPALATSRSSCWMKAWQLRWCIGMFCRCGRMCARDTDETCAGRLSRPHPRDTACAFRRGGRGGHAVPGSGQDPTGSAAASASDRLLLKARGGVAGLVVSSNERVRSDVRRNKVQTDAVRTRTRNIGGDDAGGGAQCHGDASNEVQGEDDTPEACATSGSQGAMPPAHHRFDDAWISIWCSTVADEALRLQFSYGVPLVERTRLCGGNVEAAFGNRVRNATECFELRVCGMRSVARRVAGRA